MTTRIYGVSDDLIEFEGDVRGEVCSDNVLVICSDGTLLSIEYGKGPLAVWDLNTVRKGSLINSIDLCDDEDADIYSDVAHFEDGLKWAYVATKWQKAE